MSKFKLMISLVSVVAIVILSGSLYHLYSQHTETTQDLAAQASPSSDNGDTSGDSSLSFQDGSGDQSQVIDLSLLTEEQKESVASGSMTMSELMTELESNGSDQNTVSDYSFLDSYIQTNHNEAREDVPVDDGMGDVEWGNPDIELGNDLDYSTNNGDDLNSLNSLDRLINGADSAVGDDSLGGANSEVSAEATPVPDPTLAPISDNSVAAPKTADPSNMFPVIPLSVLLMAVLLKASTRARRRG